VTAVALVAVSFNALPEPAAERPGGRTSAGPVPSASSSADVVAARLEAALRGFLNAKIPGAEYHANRPPSGAGFGPLVFEHRHKEAKNETQGAEDYYFATADIVEAGGTGNIMVGVGRSDPEKFGLTGRCPADGPLDADGYSCTPSIGPVGARIMVATTRGSKAVNHRVEAVRADGIAVFVEVTNNSRKGARAELELGRADAVEPPLTTAEATELVLLPAFTV
jgi:hypothetical protein